MPLIYKPLQASLEETEKTDILFTRFAAKHLHFLVVSIPIFFRPILLQFTDLVSIMVNCQSICVIGHHI